MEQQQSARDDSTQTDEQVRDDELVFDHSPLGRTEIGLGRTQISFGQAELPRVELEVGLDQTQLGFGHALVVPSKEEDSSPSISVTEEAYEDIQDDPPSPATQRLAPRSIPRLPPLPPPPSTPRSSRAAELIQSRRPSADVVRQGDVLLGKYRVERVIGQSRLALNVQVRHLELGQRFLLLHLHSDADTYVDSVGRFLRGARTALQLHSEHAARTIDAGRFPSGVPYVAMEYPPGSSLRHVTRISGPLAVSDAVDHVLQACLALAEAHLLGLVHGNLSSAHLFLMRRPDGFPLIKVLGFGAADALCASALDEDDSLGPPDPSVPFPEAVACLAPEQVRGGDVVSPSTDVWGIGSVLHELLTGTPVFQAVNSSALVAMIAADAPMPVTALRPDVPAGLESVILRCLAKDPNARFASIADLAMALQPYASSEAQRDIERIVRTAARTTRPPPLPAPSYYPTAPPPLSYNPNALVRLGPAPQSTGPVTMLKSVEAPSRASLALMGIGAVFALAGASLFGAAVATKAHLGNMGALGQAPVVAVAPPNPALILQGKPLEVSPNVSAVPAVAATPPPAAASAAPPVAPSKPVQVSNGKPAPAKRPASKAAATTNTTPDKAEGPVTEKPPKAKPAKDLFDDTR